MNFDSKTKDRDGDFRTPVSRECRNDATHRQGYELTPLTPSWALAFLSHLHAAEGAGKIEYVLVPNPLAEILSGRRFISAGFVCCPGVQSLSALPVNCRSQV